MSTHHGGTLVVRPICAKLTRDTETFGKMDPYCKVILGSQNQRTKIADGAGKFPNWQDQFVFKRTHEDQITIEVWDYDSGSSDDLVGSATVPFTRVSSSKNWEDWVIISHRGTNAGEVRLSCTWTADGHGDAHGHGHGAQGYPGYPQPGYPPAGYPPQPGYPPAGYPPQQGYPPAGYPPQPGYPPAGYPPQPGYPPAGYPPQPGYPQGAYPPQPGYPAYPPQPGYPAYPPQPGYPAYPPQSGHPPHGHH